MIKKGTCTQPSIFPGLRLKTWQMVVSKQHLKEFNNYNINDNNDNNNSNNNNNNDNDNDNNNNNNNNNNDNNNKISNNIKKLCCKK